MEEINIPSRDDAGQIFRQMLGSYDGPSYLRRARRTEEAYQQLLAHCRKNRDDLLDMVRLRLAQLKALAGEWEALTGLVADREQLQALDRMHQQLNPTLRMPVAATQAPQVLLRALQELGESIERFNRRWHKFLAEVDVRHVNRLRDGYNNYYVMEKECALSSPRLARIGFHTLPAISAATIEEILPCLPTIRVHGDIGGR